MNALHAASASANEKALIIIELKQGPIGRIVESCIGSTPWLTGGKILFI